MRALLLLLLAAAPAARAETLDAVEAKWLAKGFPVKERVSGENDELKASAVIYSPAEGGGDRFELYVIVKDKAYLGFSHPSTVERLDFDPSPAGRFADMFHDGSLTVSYRSTRASLGATMLNVLRWKKFKIERVGTFPEGRFIRLESGAVVAARDLPLGRYLTMGCEDFGTISRSAFKTTLHAPVDGKFLDVTADHPEYYKAEIARKEAAMARLKAELEKNAGEYLGLAISTYYDYRALGRGRDGWAKLREFFKIPALAPSSVKTCMAAMEKDLRGKLQIPAGFP